MSFKTTLGKDIVHLRFFLNKFNLSEFKKVIHQ